MTSLGTTISPVGAAHVGGMPSTSTGERVDARPDTVVVALDDTALLEGLSQLRTVVSGHLVDGGSRVVVDITGIRRLSSATVAALLWTKRHCRSRGGEVIVRGPSQDSLSMLSRAGLAGVFDIQLDSENAGSDRLGPDHLTEIATEGSGR